MMWGGRISHGAACFVHVNECTRDGVDTEKTNTTEEIYKYNEYIILDASRRGLLRLHLQLDLSHLKAPALDPELHLGACELSAGDGKAGVLVEQRRALAMALISALVASTRAVHTPARARVLAAGDAHMPTRREAGITSETTHVTVPTRTNRRVTGPRRMRRRS